MRIALGVVRLTFQLKAVPCSEQEILAHTH